MKQKHSPRAINWNNRTRSNKDGASVSPSNTYTLPHRILLQRFLNERPKKRFGDRAKSSHDKEGSRRCNIRGSRKFSGNRGGCIGWKFIWGGISNKCGIKSEYWGIWGYWGWVFLRRLGFYFGLRDLGLDWDGFYFSLSDKLALGALAALWESCWGSPQRRGWSGRERHKGKICSSMMDWYWIVDYWGEAAGLYWFTTVR